MALASETRRVMLDLAARPSPNAGVTANELALALQTSPARAERLLDDAVRAGWLAIDPDAAEIGRAVTYRAHAALTELVRAPAVQALAARRAQTRRWLRGAMLALLATLATLGLWRFAVTSHRAVDVSRHASVPVDPTWRTREAARLRVEIRELTERSAALEAYQPRCAVRWARGETCYVGGRLLGEPALRDEVLELRAMRDARRRQLDALGVER